MNAERSDAERARGAGTEELVSDSGPSKATPGQRGSSRRGSSSRRASAEATRESASAASTSTQTTVAPPSTEHSVVASSTEPASADEVPSAEPTRTLPASTLPTSTAPTTSLPSTPTELPAVPASADPPTTEWRGPLVGGPEAAVTAPVTAPAVPTNIYRARRPGVAILLIIPAVAVGVLLVQALVSAALADPVHLAGVIASVCALVSLPFLVAGVYGLVSGAAHGAEHYGFKVWARPPLAYLLVGLAFAAVAGLAVG